MKKKKILVKKIIIVGYFSAIIAFIPACKSGKQVQTEPPAPARTTNNSTQQLFKNTLPSVIHVPLKVAVSDIAQQFNSAFKNGELLYEDPSYQATAGNRFAQHKAVLWKHGNIQLRAEGDYLYAQIPVRSKVGVKYALNPKNVAKKKPTTTQAIVNVAIRTKLSLDNNWQLQTQTEVLDFEWLEKPQLSFLGSSFSIAPIASMAINKMLPDLMPQIDRQLQEQIDLKSLVQRAWNEVQRPQIITKNPDAWLLIRPKEIRVSKLHAVRDSVKLAVGVEVLTETVWAKPPKLPLVPLIAPKPMTNIEKDDFYIQLSTHMPYEQANRIAREELVGTKIHFGKKKQVTIKQVEVYPSNENLIAKVNVIGSTKATIYLTGKPAYNAQKQLLYIDDFDFDLKTKNILLKSANWLAHKSFVDKIQSQLQFPLAQKLLETKQQINQLLGQQKMGDYILLNAKLKELQPKQITLNSNGINAVILAKGRAGVKMAK